MNKLKLIICLYGGPSASKSTTAAGIFYYCKRFGLNTEMNLEYIKKWVWEGRQIKEGDQVYIFSKQGRGERMLILKNLEVIITDSPLELCKFYGDKHDKSEMEYPTIEKLIEQSTEFRKRHGYEVLNYIVPRPATRKYNPEGRFEDEKTAIEYDREIPKLLDKLGIYYERISPTCDPVEHIMYEIMSRIGEGEVN